MKGTATIDNGLHLFARKMTFNKKYQFHSQKKEEGHRTAADVNAKADVKKNFHCEHRNTHTVKLNKILQTYHFLNRNKKNMFVRKR